MPHLFRPAQQKRFLTMALVFLGITLLCMHAASASTFGGLTTSTGTISQIAKNFNVPIGNFSFSTTFATLLKYYGIYTFAHSAYDALDSWKQNQMKLSHLGGALTSAGGSGLMIGLASFGSSFFLGGGSAASGLHF